MVEIVGIAAVARNGVIGAGSEIPWRIPEDLRRFKQLTTSQVLIMGRKTFDAIGRPLPGRTTIVITRDKMWRGEGTRAAWNLEEALRQAVELAPQTIFVAGGGEIYREAWDRMDRLEITEVDAEPEGDVTFPEISATDWRETAREAHDGYALVSYVRAHDG